MTVSLSELWLAILIAGGLCWVASSLIHMLFKYHNADYQSLPNEDEVATALRNGAPKPALYTLPHCIDMKAMGEESMQKKFNDGPVAMISVMPNGMPPMGKLLGQQVAFFIVGSLLIGYIATLSMSASSDYMTVFRHVLATAFVAYGWAQIPYSIWMGQPWSNCMRYLLDAVIYAGVTAGSFAFMWPEVI
ncbi:hypothetical protein [Alteromonas flava]|uniref:hypothetical protein n=1 Tax=Alteromonas flava TaxID=2048003 RepID=UPI000C293486|nr:hypothetical protein [Alteromonas flava]